MDFHATPYRLRLIAHIRQDQASLAFRKRASFLMRLLSAFALLHVWQVSRSCFGTVCSVLPKHDTWTTQRSAWYNLLSWQCWTKQGHKDPPETLLNWKPCWISPRWSKQVVRSLECIWTYLNKLHFKSHHDENLLVTKNPSSPCTASLVHCSWSRAVSRSSAFFDLMA